MESAAAAKNGDHEQLTELLRDDRLAQAAHLLVGALDKPGTYLTDEERRAVEVEAARRPFPSERLAEVLHAISARPGALAGEDDHGR